MNRFMIIGGMACFWLFSPEALTLIGVSAGRGGYPAVSALLGWALIIAICLSIMIVSWRLTGAGGEDSARFGGDEPLLLRVLLFAGIYGVAILASTGMLVTAGFAFNEIFFYRFPNFGFAALLLAGVVVLQQAPERVQYTVQYGATLTCAVGLLVLIVAGLMGERPVVEPLQSPSGHGVLPYVTLVVVFLGFDQIALQADERDGWHLLPVLFVGSSMVLAIWLLLSIQYVNGDRLADTSIPYLIAAREILGQAGRSIMGLIVIAGAFAASHGLFILARIYLTARYPSARTPVVRRGLPLIMGLVIGLLMVMGLAGSANLETYIRGTVLIWLSGSALAVLRGVRFLNQGNGVVSVAGYVGGALMLVSVFFMASHASQPYLMGYYMGVTFVISAFCITLLEVMRKKSAS